MDKIDQLVRRGADALEAPPSRGRLSAQRQRLLGALEGQDTGHRWPRALFGAAAATVLLALGVGVWFSTRPSSSLSFWIGGATAASREGAQVRADDGRAASVRFSDGSQVELSAGARGRVERASHGRVDFTLEAGALRAHVKPGTRMAWHFRAGEYVVRVTGTTLAITWTEDPRRLRVHVEEGLVHVKGPGVVGDLAVGANERVAITAEGLEREPLEEAPTPAGSTAEPVEPTRPTREPRRAQPPPHVARSTSRDDWRVMALGRKHEEAMAAARRLGLHDLQKTLPVEDLELLADVARYARDTDAAETTLQTLRQRFPRHPLATKALFLLGRLASEARGDHRRAAGLFEQYLANAGDTALAEEALGRLFDARYRAGLEREAREAAQRYLGRYPQGAYAGAARRIVGEAR